MKVIKSLRAPVLVTLVLLLICGLIYPVVMTLMSQALFPQPGQRQHHLCGRPGCGRQERGPGFH